MLLTVTTSSACQLLMKNRFHSRLRCPHDDYATSDLIGQNTAFPFFWL